MANVDKIGKGFLDKAGQLKDTQALKAEEAAQAKKSQAKSESQDTNDQSVSTALKPVRSRFNEDVNSVISVVNENDENLKKALDNTNDQIKVAKELKQALKEEDSKAIEKKRAELERLQAQKNKIAEEVDRDNKRLSEDRIQSVSLGNKQIETFKIDPVKISKSEPTEIDKPKDVNQLIDELETEKESIKAQRQELKEVKKEIKAVVSEVRKEVNSIEKSSIKSIEEAGVQADKLANDIVKAGAQEALVSNIDENVVKNLLAA